MWLSSASRRLRLNVVSACCLSTVVTVAGCQSIMLPDPAVRYIAFGDSTAAGPADVQYWEILREDLGASFETFAGQGVGGEATGEGLERLDMLLDNGIFPNAEVLLYWQGGKDILEFVRLRDPLIALSPTAEDYPFQDGLQATLDGAQTNIEQAIATAQQGGLHVYVATYYYLSPDTGSCDPALLNILLPAQAERVNEYVGLLNERIRLAARNTGATLVDVAALAEQILADPANYADCRHLSTRGNRIAADLFEQAIEDR